MSQIVHLIKNTGTRFEFRFDDKATPEHILKVLEAAKRRFGYNGTTIKDDPDHPNKIPTNFDDPSSGFAFDHPETRVVILQANEAGEAVLNEKGEPIEVKKLKGP